MDLGLKDKAAIITGGSGGIGGGMVLEFAREGLNVISASRDVSTGQRLVALAKARGFAGRIIPVATDVTDRASVASGVCGSHHSRGHRRD